MFDEHKLKAFIKTSGKTGMHLLLPCAGLSFPEARTIAVNISKEVTAMIPDVATSENTIAIVTIVCERNFKIRSFLVRNNDGKLLA